MASVVTGQNLILKLVYILGWENRLGKRLAKIQLNREGFDSQCQEKARVFYYSLPVPCYKYLTGLWFMMYWGWF